METNEERKARRAQEQAKWDSEQSARDEDGRRIAVNGVPRVAAPKRPPNTPANYEAYNPIVIDYSAPMMSVLLVGLALLEFAGCAWLSYRLFDSHAAFEIVCAPLFFGTVNMLVLFALAGIYANSARILSAVEQISKK